MPLFDPKIYQTDVFVHGKADQGRAFIARTANGENFFWVLQGSAKLKIEGETYSLKYDDTILVPKNSWIEFEDMSEDSAILSTTMDAKNRARVGF